MNLTTGYPYSLIDNGLVNTYPSLTDSIKTEVAIIGGGISGALTAYYLVNAGLDCVVVDARSIGLGSTCASTSLLQYELDKPLSVLSKQIGFKSAARAYTMCSEAIDTIENISVKINFKLFEKTKSLYFAAYKKDKKLIESEFEYRKKAGFQLQLLSDKEVQNKFGFASPSAILSEQGATIDAYMFTHALLQTIIKKGGGVFDRTKVTKIEYKRNGVKLITGKGHYITAGKVVNASGYEITEFVDKKIVNLNSTYAIASEHIQSHVPVWKDGTLLWNTADPYLYMRLTKDNRVIIGGRDEEFYNTAKRDKLIKKKTALLKKDFSKLFPDIELIPEFSWTGTFGSTKDALPYIGTYNKTPHTYYALGFGGNGITFSVIAAEIILDMITGKKNKDASLFSFAR
ncbi:MAG TPA: FAD-binding oxidoreductase [Ignavibacteriales bacterium]|nr:FAD-binding oxidoreductase [Ignavibacteriales bacterium]